MISDMKIVFMGTPEFGAIVLDGLVNGGFKPVLVITEPDKPVGRKQIITSPSVKITAEKYKIPVLQPKKILDTKYQLLDTRPDIIVVAAYGQILPKEILEIPKYGCLNVHSSLLPRWRGPSPIQFPILNGDKKSGVTIMLMDEKIDHGPIISQKEVEIEENETAETLYNKLAKIGVEILLTTIPKWMKKEIKPITQNHKKATFSKILAKEDGRIDWNKPAEYIERQIRAFIHWPGTFTLANGKKIKILKAHIQKQTKTCPNGIAGKTFLATNEKIAVQTSKDFIIIESLQLEGKKPVSSAEFLLGHSNFIGTILK